MDNNVGLIVIVALVVFFVWCLWTNSTPQRENLSGYGVTSGLAFNNRLTVCQEGDDLYGGSWSGGCFRPGYVII